ncbi:MAG: hypothetical protein U0Y82_16820 [Thermoleophilia bacterium]
MLKSFPLDTARMKFVAVDTVAVFEFTQDGGRSDRQRTDADGRLVFRVNTLCIVEGEAGGETVPVRVAFDAEPGIVPLTEVTFTNLQARPWAQGDRSGIALSADSCEPAHSQNGRARKPDPLASAEPVAS